MLGDTLMNILNGRNKADFITNVNESRVRFELLVISY